MCFLNYKDGAEFSWHYRLLFFKLTFIMQAFNLRNFREHIS